MKVSFLLFCDVANVTKDSKFVLHGVFTAITAKKVPAIHPIMSVAYQIEDTELQKGDKIDFVLRNQENGKDIFNHTKEISESVGDRAIGQIINLVGLNLETFGKYEGRLLINGSEVSTSLLEVKELK